MTRIIPFPGTPEPGYLPTAVSQEIHRVAGLHEVPLDAVDLLWHMARSKYGEMRATAMLEALVTLLEIGVEFSDIVGMLS